MESEAVSGTMLTLLLVSVIHFATVNSVARSTGFSSDLLNYGISSETEDWWEMFHHDQNHTGYSTSAVHDYLKSLWNYTTEGAVSSSPAVVNETVYVGSDDGYLYALNATTNNPDGEVIWKTEKPIDSVRWSSPAVADRRVFVGACLGSRNGSVYALDAATLDIEWNYTTEGWVVSSPVVDDGKVFVGSNDTRVYALDARTDNPNGTKIWDFPTKGVVRSSPLVSDGVVYVGSDYGYIYAIEAETGNEKWRFRTADPVVSSPAVFDGNVFVGVNDGRVYALNAATGKYLWHFETGGAVRSSPAVADGVVFVGSNDWRVYALNVTDGSLIWNFTTGGAVVSSPAIAKNKVFVGSDDYKIYALNVTDGSLIWNFTTGGAVQSSPAIAEGKVFVGSLDKKVYAFAANEPPQAFFGFYPISPIVTQMVTFNASASYDPDGNITNYTWSFGDGTPPVTETDPIATHTYNVAGTYNVSLNIRDNFKPFSEDTTSQLIKVREAWPMFRHDLTHIGNSIDVAPVSNTTLWKQKIGPPDESPWMYPSPAVINDVVFIASPNGTVYALNATNNGTVIWSKTPAPGYRIYGSPAFADGSVFIGAENGFVYVLNATNGNLIQNIAVSLGVAIYSSPTVLGNRVFIGLQNHRVYALNKTEGSILQISPDLGGAIDSSPAVANGRVFVGSMNGNVYALDETTLEIIWSSSTNGPVRSSPAVADDIVFIGSEDDNVYAFNALTGKQIWNFPTNGDVNSSPAVAHSMVFIGSMDGNMYALDMLTGNKAWNKTIGPISWSSPAVAEGKVFVGSTNGKIYALYEESGDVVWSYQTEGPVDSSPAILNDILYVGSKDGNIYAFHKQAHDINVTKVTPSETEVPKGVPIIIDVTIRNEGTFNETNINVTIYYSNSTFTYKADNITIASLARGAKITEPIPWNTTNVTPGTYNISVYATPVPNEIETIDNQRTYGPVNILPPGTRDIAVINLTSCYGSAIIAQNRTYTVNVTVENQGDYTETFTLTLYWNTTNVIKSTSVSLAIGETKVVQFQWNTTGYQRYTYYQLSAYATPVPGETDTADNTFVDPRMLLMTYPGDLNGDKKVDIKDIAAIAKLFGINHPDPRYDPDKDITCDGKTDIKDIAIAAKNFGYIEP